jgi:hypothetical protein
MDPYGPILGSGVVTVDFKSNAGIVLAAFVGALNVIGLTSGEVPNILRDEGDRPTFLMVTLLAAVLCAVGSVLLKDSKTADGHPASNAALIATSLLMVAIAAFGIAFVSLPDTHVNVAWGVFGASALGIVLTFAFKPEAKTDSRVSRQTLLLLTSVVLTSLSVFTAVRLETRSESQAVSPELGVSVVDQSGSASVSIKVTQTGLSPDEYVGLAVNAVPRSFHVKAFCATLTATQAGSEPPCPIDPCDSMGTRQRNQVCQQILGTIVLPDANGEVSQQFEFPVSAKRFSRIHVTAQACRKISESSIAGCNFEADDQSVASKFGVNYRARMDAVLPAPSGH